MAFTPVSAKNAQVRIGASVYTANKWEVRPEVDALDITNFEGIGFADWISGIISAEFTVDADWDSAANNFGSPPNITAGAILTNVRLYLNSTSGSFWSFPSSLVVGTPTTAEVRGKVSVTFTAKAKGIFTYP